MLQPPLKSDFAAFAAVGQKSLKVFAYKCVVYVRTEAADYVIDYHPRPIPSHEADEAIANGRWVGYKLGKEILKAVRESIDARNATEYLRGGGSSDIIRKLRDSADAAQSEANGRLQMLGAIAVEVELLS